MQKQGKSSPACESSSESSSERSNKTQCASASYCSASCVSTHEDDEDDVSRSTSATEKTITP